VIPNASQLSAMSKLFSSAVSHQMAKRGGSARFARLFKMTGVDEICTSDSTVGEGSILPLRYSRVGQRDEYVYRAAITHKVLMGKHSLNAACMLG
jgi:hypothetical protein